jgi:hypothetical protein
MHMQHSFEARLVPLNKQWPVIPAKEQFRVILSPLFKWLELRFVWRLNHYLTKGVDIHQTGFVKGMGTHINLRLLLEKLRASKKSDTLCTFFMDYKSAYNTVLCECLYDTLVRKEILTTEEAQLHACLHFKVGNDKFFFRNGVH